MLDVRTFENNSRIRLLYLRDNLLEFLPRNLFKNNFLLEEVHLSRNLLKNIEIDFTALRYANASYKNEMYFGENRFTNLIEFQREIRINCSYYLVWYVFNNIGEINVTLTKRISISSDV